MSLQLRLWLTVVVIVVAGALVLVIGTSALYERVMLPFEMVSAQSLIAVKAARTLHGAEAVDAATAATVDPAVRGAAAGLASGKTQLTPDAEAALLGRAGSQGAPTFALLVKPDGTIAAKAGDAKLEGPLAGQQVFAEAATGVARDGLRFIDGVAWHLAGAPVYDGANLAAVVILGWPYDSAFADRLTQQIGAPVVLIAGGKRLGAALPELSVEQLATRGLGVGAVDVGPVPGPLPLLVPDKTRFTLLSLPVFSGDDQLAIAVATDRNEALRALAYGQALVIAGTLLIALLQLVLVWSTMRAVSKPIEVIVNHLSQVSQGNSVGILPEAALSGQFLRLGKQVNMILQMMPSASRAGAPLGSLGSSAPFGAPSMGAPSAPPREAGDEFPSLAPPRTATPNAPPVGDINLGGAKGPTPASAGPPSALSSLFDDQGADPLAAFRVPPAGNASRGPPPAPVEAEAAESEALPPEFSDAPSAMSPEATVMFQVPQELLNQSAQASPAPPPARAPGGQKMADDARTVIAQVPQELLAAGAPRDGLTSADETHYKEVYTKFVETRVQCGEDTSDLTYDRFVAKLMKNRQQIVEKHKAKSVRFQVYVKEGKAALRALPVRD